MMRIEIDLAVVAENFARHSENPSLQESAQLLAAGGLPVEMLQALAMNPGALRAFSGFADVYPCGMLERPIMEKVILQVSRMHDCQFCVSSHLAMTRQLGIAEEAETPREKLAVEYARQMTVDANRIPYALFDELRAAFTAPEIVELTFLTGLITLLNRFNNALQVRYGGEYDAVKVR